MLVPPCVQTLCTTRVSVWLTLYGAWCGVAEGGEWGSCAESLPTVVWKSDMDKDLHFIPHGSFIGLCYQAVANNMHL